MAHLSAVYLWSKYVVTTGTGRKGSRQLASEEEGRRGNGGRQGSREIATYGHSFYCSWCICIFEIFLCLKGISKREKPKEGVSSPYVSMFNNKSMH